MANEIDERIVEARFDASDFEKGVNKTIDKLNELKESLNLKDSGKSITDFAKDTSENVDKAGNALQRLSDRFTTFKGMIKQQILSGLASEISNVFLSIEQSLVRFTRSISSEQVSAGMNKYTEILNSVRTMTAAGVDQDIAYDKIKRLAEYSDQTSYSLSQMTSGMSKLVAAGMEVDKAEKSMEGLANMAASAGVNIYEAQRAFINFSQAYSSGKMRIQDWTSFETLNMATEPVMKIFMQAAEEVGNLTKTVDKNGKEVYKTTNKINKEIKNGKEVATSGFRDTLSYGWLDKKTMEQATAVLSYFEDLGVDLNELSEDELSTFAAKAFQAAKEARSFADVMGTIKDVVATGWANTFEIIFGKLDKATEFFTWLTESKFAEIIYSIGEFRNAMLGAWGSDPKDGGLFKVGGTGRDFLLASLKNLDAMIGKVHEGLASFGLIEYNKTLGRYLTFPEILGKRLALLTKRFNHFTVNLYNGVANVVDKIVDTYTWVRHVGDETTRTLKPQYEVRLQKITQGLASVFNVLSKLGGILGNTIGKVIIELLPVFEAVGDAIGTILEPITNLDNNTEFFQDLTNSIDNLLLVVQPLIEPISAFIRLLGQLGAIFIDLGISSVISSIDLFAETIGFIIELFGGTSAQKMNEGVGVIEGWGEDLKSFADTCKQGIIAIKDFFTNLFADIKALLGIGDETEGKEGGFFNNVAKFFETNEFVQKVKAWIDQAIADIGAWILDIPNKIRDLGISIGDFFKGLFYTKNEDGKEVETPFKVWLDQTITNIGNWIKNLPKELSKGLKTLGTIGKKVWNMVDEFLFGKKVQTVKYDGKQWVGATSRVKSGFSKWLDNLGTSIGDWIKKIPEKAENLWKTITDFLFGEEITTTKVNPETNQTETVKTRVKEGFSKWLNNTITTVKDAIHSVPGLISALWNNIIDFIFGKEVTVKEVDENGVATEKTTRVKEGFSKWLEDTGKEIENWITTVPDQIAAVWNKVLDFIFGEEVTVKDVDENGVATEKTTRVKAGFSKWLADTCIEISGWAASIPGTVSKVWNLILDAIFGKDSFDQSYYDKLMKDDPTGYAATQYMRSFDKPKNPIIEAAEKTVEALGIDIGKVFSDLPLRIAEGINFGSGLLTDLISHVTDWFKDQNAKDKAAKEAGETTKGLMDKSSEEAAKEIEGTEEANPILTAIISVGQTIGSLVTETIPALLSEAFTFVGNNAGGWWESIKNILNLDNFNWGDITQGAIDIGNKIGDEIRNIPGYIEAAVKGLEGLFSGETELEKARKEITAAFTDEAGNIVDKKGLQHALKDAEKTVSDTSNGSGIWEMIKSIGTSIGGAFVDLGPYILDGITTAITWVGGKIGDVTDFLAKGHEKGLKISDMLSEKLVDENGKSNPFWEKIQELGRTLKSFIVETIPNFLKEAFNEISMTLPEIISNIFGGEEEPDTEGTEEALEGAEKMVTEVGKVQEKAMEQVNQQQGSSLIDWLINLFIGSASAEDLEDIESAVNDAEKASDNINDIQNNIEKQKRKGTNGYSLIDLLTGNYNQNDFDETAKTGEKTKETVTGFLGAFNSVLDGLGKFSGSQLAMYAVIAVGIAAVIHSLADMLSVTDEIEGVGYTAKWEGIKYAILGIVGLLGWLSYLSAAAANDPNDKRLESTMSTLDKVIGFIERIGTVITTIASIKAGGTVFETIGSFFGWREAKATSKALGTTGKWYQNIGASILGKVSEFLMFAVGSDIVGGGIESMFESLASVFADIGLGVDNLVTHLAPAIEHMAQMSDNVDDAISVVEKVKTLIDTLNDMLGATDIAAEMMGHASGNKNLGDTGIMTVGNLEKRMSFIFAISTLMTNISKSLKTFESIDDPRAQMEKMLEVVNDPKFLEFIMQAIGVIYGTLTKTFGGSMVNLDVAAIGFEMLANAFSVFGDGISGLNIENVEALQKTLDVFNNLATSLTDTTINQSAWNKVFSGDNSLSHFGQEIQAFGGSIKSFFNYLVQFKGFEESDVEETQLKIDAVIKIAQELAIAAQHLATFGGADSLDYFGTRLRGFGSNVGAFITAVNSSLGEGIDMSRIQMVSIAVTALSDLAKGIGAMGDFDAEDIPELFSGFMQAISENLEGENDFFTVGQKAGANLDAGLAAGISSGQAILAAQALAAAISGSFTVSWEMHSPSKLFEGFGEFLNLGLKQGIDENRDAPISAAEAMAQESVDNVTSILETIKDLAINDMDITPTITPVVDLSNVEHAAEQIQLLGFGGTSFQFDTSGLSGSANAANPELTRSTTPVAIDYSSLLGSIRGDLTALGSQISGMNNFSGMQVVLDTGAIVGGIIDEVDRQLGRRSFYAGREG